MIAFTSLRTFKVCRDQYCDEVVYYWLNSYGQGIVKEDACISAGLDR